MKIKDIKAAIGVFEFVNNQLYSLQQDIENSKEVNGMYDAGNLFHIDLLKQIPDMDKSIEGELKYKLLNSTNPYDYPRGRVCYNINNDLYLVFADSDTYKIPNSRTLIAREFHLPLNKTEFYIDDFYEYKPKRK